MKTSVLTLPSGRFIWLGVLFSIGFWFADSLIDSVFFSHASFLESLQPGGMELYMRLLLCGMIIAFGYLTSRYVESNNHLNRYIALSLKEDSNRYKAIFETAPFLMLVLNKDLMIIEWNAEAGKTFGWNPHEAMGQNFYSLLFPEDARPENPSLAHLIPTGFLVAPNLTRNGKSINCSWSHTGIPDWEGKMTSVLLVGQLFSDIQGIKAQPGPGVSQQAS